MFKPLKTLPIALLAIGGTAEALTLGQIHVQSYINEPLKAVIDVNKATEDEIRALRIKLADRNAFSKVGVDYTREVQELRFAIVETPKGTSIEVTSQTSISEPFLSFVIDANWNKGSVSKDYTVLLDPPIYTDRFAPPVMPADAGIGIKPISATNTKRLVARAIAYALDNGFSSVTLMHKGNIMKFTEGAFAQWGYEVAAEKFKDQTITEAELWDDYQGKQPQGKVVIKDRIADMLFQQVLLRPNEFGVIATPNLNGDYLSDALAAQVGGLGMAPGANIGDQCAVFEATHGTAPKYAGLDKVNPSSLILSGAMMLDHMGWREASRLMRDALQAAIEAKTVTYDLARQIRDAKQLKCSEFGQAIIRHMG